MKLLVSRTGADREAWFVLSALAFLVAVPLALFWPVFLSGKMIYGYDVSAVHVAFRAAIDQSLAAHQWPLWLPGLLAGAPGIASNNVSFLYPSDLVSALAGWPLRTQYGLDAAIHVALAGVGMFLFLRRLGRSISASLLGAFFFAVSGSELSQLFGGYNNFVEGVALAPWAFWAAHKGFQEKSWAAWGLCGLAFALQILSISSQLFAYTLAAVAAFVLALAWSQKDARTAAARSSGRLAACVPALQGLALALALAFLLSAPQLWLSLQYLPLSARAQGWTMAQFFDGSISPAEALTWVVPGFFGWQTPTYHGAMGLSETSEYFGLLPWALAAGAAFALWRREAWVRWMAALALTAFFFAQCRSAVFYGICHRLPVLSGFRIWSRTLFLLTFAVCTMAAFGWDALRTASRQAAALRGAAAFAALALSAAALAWCLAPARASADAAGLIASLDLSMDPRQMAGLLAALAKASAVTTLTLVPVLAALLWLGTKRLGAGAALVLALGFHALDQSQLAARFVTFMDPGDAVGHPRFTAPPPAPAGLEPWRVLDTDLSFPNNDLILGYENLDGRESMPLQCYQGIKDALRARPQDWASLMNERYFFSHSQRGSSVPGDSVTIYTNRRAFPRAWLAASAVAVPSDKEAYRLLADPAFNPRTTVTLPAGDAPVPPPAAHGTPQGGVRWLGRSPQTCSLDVSTDREAVLVLSNTWYPSWRCAVDGRDTPVLKADGGLQAVVLKAGRHRVDFRFDNGLFYDALAACLAGIAALFGLAWL